MSWDPTIATMDSPHQIGCTAWSPCSRFIAISLGLEEVQILDAATLKKVVSFTPPKCTTQLLSFSPESHLLTWLGKGSFINWDLQTGVQIGEIPTGEGVSSWNARSITYSECGTMFGVLFRDRDTPSISVGIYDVLSNVRIHHHQVSDPIGRLGTYVAWTHNECLQFTALGPRFITIWEVGFASKQPPTEVRTLPAPDNFDPHPSKHSLFLPTLSRLAFVAESTIYIWDAQCSKLLLNSADLVGTARIRMSFSPDGHFFACGTHGAEIYLWEESPDGYDICQKIVSGDMGGWPTPLLSPNGDSIILLRGSNLQLRRTSNSTISPSGVVTRALAKDFILGFSSDESLAVIGQLEGDTATVLDLKSGVPWLTIDTGVQIIGLGVAGGTTVVVGNEKIITWSLPAGDHPPNARANIKDSIQTTMIDCPAPRMYIASVSPTLNHIAIMEEDWSEYIHLSVYSVSTGKRLTDTFLSRGSVLWFAPDGHKIWSYDGIYRGWAITGDSGSNITKLEPLEPDTHLGRPPWQPPHGYQVTDSGWTLSSSGKRLLWMPHYWRDEIYRMWGEQYLALLHPNLPEVIILELPEK